MSIPILATFKPVYSFLSWPYQIFCKSYPQLEIISSPLSPSLVNAKPSNSGKLTEGKNVRNGVLSSTDWGAMQINDKAHPKAFPRAKHDLEYNIDYGLNF